MSINGIIKEYGDTFPDVIQGWLVNLGVSQTASEYVRFPLVLMLLVLVCWLSDIIARKVILNVIQRIVKRTKTDWDDILFEKKVFNNIAHLVPALILEALIPSFLGGHPNWVTFGITVSHLYLIIGIAVMLVSVVRVVQVLIMRYPFMKDRAIDSYVQLLNIVIYILAAIYVVSVLLGKSPWGIFSALGAMSVVLMLVFKDTILGLVASIQLAANDMVKVGDWVEMPKYGADGNVIEIKLQTIKVKNWDKTITTVPTYAFVSDAFKNWRGMEDSGGRRIKRSLFIDVNSIKFCDNALLNKLNRIEKIASYLQVKSKEVESYNSKSQANLESLVNGRRLTNVGTFRAYVEAYLKDHEKINKDMTFLIRQLQPTEKGLPIEIYVFSAEKSWVEYEGIQSDIFDHVLSVVNEFDLRVFQSPSGSDFEKIVKS